MMVVLGLNTVYSVFFLILAFANGAGLLLMLHAEFLAFLLLIVYVGAVAVLFLFVVMMIDGEKKFSPALMWRSGGIPRYSLAVGLSSLILTVELVLVALTWRMSSEALISGSPLQNQSLTFHTMGQLLYTSYVLPFQGVGFIFLIAMVGAIVLTLRHRDGTRKQQVSIQVARQPEDSLRLVDLPRGKVE